MDQINKMKAIWANRVPRRIDGGLFRDAAVLVPLLKIEGKTHLLFEVRAEKLKIQPGEVCFPGGTIEKTELPEAAAVRETTEELLIRFPQVELIASLDILYLPANMAVYPFLGILRDYEYTFSPDEVDRLITVPLDWLLEYEPELHRTKVVTQPGTDFPYELIPAGKDYKWRQGRYDVLFYRYQDNVIWGMTAKILHSFIELYREEFLEELPPAPSDTSKTEPRLSQGKVLPTHR